VRYDVVDELVVDPDRLALYVEGWQSWSPTAWWRPGTVPRPDLDWQHTMRFRPDAPLTDAGWQAEGLLAVDPGGGRPVRTYGAPAAEDDVPSVRATLDGDRLTIAATGELETAEAPDPVDALERFGDGFAAAAGVAPLRPPPRVWCSWYQYFEALTSADVHEALDDLDTLDLPVEVVQIDDGWTRGLGEWLEPSPGVPSLPDLVARIRDRGRRAGIWLAPFLVGRDTALAREHPDWLLGDAGRNWGQPLVGLDLTHPDVREYLAGSVRALVDLGVDYLKLDFLYAGALPGRRSQDVSPVAAYRSGLRLLREAAGEDAYLVGCGAPLLPSVGLLDAMRVSPDTFHEGGEDGSHGLRGRPSLVARAWQQGRFWVNDSDCLVARPSYGQRELWAETVARFGGLRSCSDRLRDLDEWGLETTRTLLAAAPPPEPFDREVVGTAREEAS
jgi:alpha-galactosidase